MTTRPGGATPSISKTVLTDIKSRVDIVKVIGLHVELKQAGTTFKGNCPFHEEKTPSFVVMPEERRWRCFGCHAYGDVFSFVQKVTGKAFPVVVRELAREVGVEVPDRDNFKPPTAAELKAASERKALFGVLEAAAAYWAQRLWGDEKSLPPPEADAVRSVRSYLRARGVSDDAAKSFRLGFAPAAYHDLEAALKRDGYDEESLANAGLVIRRREGGGVFDRFRSRLMVPVTAADGKVIAFGGRAVLDNPEPGPKYMNSPGNSIYTKGQVLFALHHARDEIRRTGEAVVVEGYFDAIALHQAGLRTAVAVCGTALTGEQVELLQRHGARSLTLLFDGDAAGSEASLRAAPTLLRSGLSCRVALLPAEGGKVDPDEYARKHGKAAVEELVVGAQDLTEFLLEAAVRSNVTGSAGGTTVEQKLRVLHALVPALAACGGLVRSAFERRIARRLDLDVGALRAELAALLGTDAAPPRGRT